MKEQVHKQLVDEAMEAYVDWREECAEVWNAYERWARPPKIDDAGAFAAYRAALDREESASHAYADLLGIAGGKGSIGDDDDAPAVEPTAFAADGRWASAPPRLDGDPETGLLSAELRGRLLQAVDALSPDQRAVITLRDLVGLPAAEVCDLLELSDGNQRVLLHRARARVRSALVPLVEVTH